MLPPDNWPCNLPCLTQEQSQILDQEIQNLLQKNAIESTVSTKGFFSSMFTVPKKDGGWRPIINLRSLNSYLVVSHFKMEGIGSLKDVLQEGDFMGKIDLEDAYLSVPVHQEHRDFLKFCWRQKIYRFRSLPFGLATAPRVFTKILRPLVARMRMTGLRIIVYLDDMLVMAQSAERLMSHMQTLARELQALGFKLNHKKCVWEPVQAIEFLGFLVNSKTMKIYLPEEKIQKVMKECRHTINKRSVTARHLAHLIGLLSSTAPAISVAPFHYRGLQRLRQRALQNSRGNYDHEIVVDKEAEADLLWWVEHVRGSDGHPVVHPSADMILTTDASKSGWGATDQERSTGGMWTQDERKAHINCLEMKAALLALQTFVSTRQNIHILLLIDNSSAIAYINHKGGTHSRAMSDLALEIWEWCLTRRITIHAEHIPGVYNTVADAESRRSFEPSDWKLHKGVFDQLQKVWGPHNVDLFAARHNRQLPRYFSFKPDPEAEAVDALAQCWSDLRAYAFPPFALIGRCLRKLEQEEVKELVLIVPVWHNQTWFPTLLTKLIDLPILLPDLKKIITNPAGEAHPLIEKSSLHLAACRVSGQVYRNKEFLMSLSESFQQHGGKARKNLIHQHGESGYFGVVEQTPIPFHHLSGRFWTF